MQLVTLFRFVEVLVDAPGGATLTFYTDMPGDALAVRKTGTISATTGRHPYRLSLPGTTKGKLYQVKIVPITTSAVRIYKAKVYARVLGPGAAPWAWYDVPVLETSDGWSEIKLPIPVTSDEWQAKQLPIPPTPENYSEVALPVKPTPVVPEWVQVQVDG